MAHLPFMQFYPGDWLKDTRRLRPSVRGHWIDLLCAMWDSPTRGEVVWPIYSYASFLGVSAERASDIIIELLETKTADGAFLNDAEGECENCETPHDYGHTVSNCQENVRLRNRRMSSDEIIRKNNRKDQKNSRDRKKSADSQGDVRAKSGRIYHKSEVRSHKEEEKSAHAFDSFYAAYPNKKSPEAARKAWVKLNPDPELVDIIIAAVDAQKEWRRKRPAGAFTPEWKHPATWLNDKCWLDELDESVQGQTQGEFLG